MYSGTKEETVTETRTKMYMKQNIKSSYTLIPDESSLMEHLRRADLQTYIWKQYIMAIPALNGRGWVDEEGKVSPVWFQSPQLPPTLTRKRTQKTDGYAADSDEEMSTNEETVRKCIFTVCLRSSLMITLCNKQNFKIKFIL